MAVNGAPPAWRQPPDEPRCFQAPHDDWVFAFEALAPLGEASACRQGGGLRDFPGSNPHSPAMKRRPTEKLGEVPV